MTERKPLKQDGAGGLAEFSSTDTLPNANLGAGAGARGYTITVGNALMGDTLRMCDYLDAGDGVQLQAALTAAGAGTGKNVWLRPGTVTLTAANPMLTVPDNVQLWGVSRETTTIVGISVSGMSQQVLLMGANSCLSDMTITSPAAISGVILVSPYGMVGMSTVGQRFNRVTVNVNAAGGVLRSFAVGFGYDTTTSPGGSEFYDCTVNFIGATAAQMPFPTGFYCGPQGTYTPVLAPIVFERCAVTTDGGGSQATAFIGPHNMRVRNCYAVKITGTGILAGATLGAFTSLGPDIDGFTVDNRDVTGSVQPRAVEISAYGTGTIVNTRAVGVRVLADSGTIAGSFGVLLTSRTTGTIIGAEIHCEISGAAGIWATYIAAQGGSTSRVRATCIAPGFDISIDRAGGTISDVSVSGSAATTSVSSGSSDVRLSNLKLSGLLTIASGVTGAIVDATTTYGSISDSGTNTLKVNALLAQASANAILANPTAGTAPVTHLAPSAALQGLGTDAAGTLGFYRPALFESTGVLSGFALTINADPTKFNLAAGVAGFADYSSNPAQPTRSVLSYAGGTALAVPGLASAATTYVGIDSSGTVIQQVTPFTNTQRRSVAIIGLLVHTNLTIVNAVNTILGPLRAGINQVHDYLEYRGPLSKGLVYSANGANLNINRSAGSIFKFGANFQNSTLDPHVVTFGSGTTISFRYRTRNGEVTSDVTAIDPNQYDLAGTLTPVASNRYTIQHIVIFQSGLTRIQYGQALYTSLDAAVAAFNVEDYTVEQNMNDNGVFRCWLIVRGGTTDLTDTARVKFITATNTSTSVSSSLGLPQTGSADFGSANLLTTGNVSGAAITGTGTVSGAALTATGNVSGVDLVLTGKEALSAISDPTAPSAGTGVLYGFSQAGDIVPRWRSPNGTPYSIQRALSRAGVVQWGAPGTASGAVVDRLNCINPVGYSSSLGAQLAEASAAALPRSAMRRFFMDGGTSTSSFSGIRANAASYWRGSSGTQGGFYWSTTFAIGITIATQGLFCGLAAATGAVAANTVPSSFVDCIGFGYDSGDSTCQILHNDSSGSCTKIPLVGWSQLATTDLIEVAFWCAPASTTISYRIENRATGLVATGTTGTSDLPTATTFLGWTIYHTCATVSGRSFLEWMGFYGHLGGGV